MNRRREIERRDGNGDDSLSLLKAVLACIRRGWCIIPVVGKKPAPRLKWKSFQTTRPDKATTLKLFDRDDLTGLAVIHGSVSGGLVCRDFDLMDAYFEWAEAYPEFAKSLPTVRTHRGFHVYCRGPEKFKKLANGEYRGDSKHYTLLPPSAHPEGGNYRWIISLPDGELPLIDPFEAGLWTETERTERTERTEGTKGTERTEPTEQIASVPLGEDVMKAIASTLPTQEGQRHHCLFLLARELKSIPRLSTAMISALRPIVEKWHREALPVIRTKDFPESWSDFATSWKNVLWPAGKGPIDLVLRRAAESQPPKKVRELYRRDDPKLLLLASLCRGLQSNAGDADFYRDLRTAGRLLDVPRMTVWRWLGVLCADEILRAGEVGSHATHRASRFRYITD